MEIFLSICVGLSLAACCGFRIFVPMLVANIASLFGWYHFSEGFEFMGTWIAFAILATATVCEIAAYYIPFLDNLMDKLALPLAVAAGVLISTSFLSADITPPLKWGLGIIAGGGAAGLIHAATGLLRLGSSAGTGGVANPILATGENAGAFTFAILSFVIPIVTIIAALLLIWFLVKKLLRRKQKG